MKYTLTTKAHIYI